MARDFGSVRALIPYLLWDLGFKFGRRVLHPFLYLASKLEEKFGDSTRSLRNLLKASRFTDSTRYTPQIAKKMALLSEHAVQLIGVPDCSREQMMARCVMLAPPLINENGLVRKGVLLVSFTETSGRLFVESDKRKLVDNFHLVLEPSFAGYADPGILCWGSHPEPVLVQSSEARDFQFLERLDSSLVPVSYGAGDWIMGPSEDDLSRVPKEKEYDALCVANHNLFKRVHTFISAVAYAAKEDPEYKALLVLAGHGQSAKSMARIRSLLDYYGVQSVCEIKEKLTQKELFRVFRNTQVLVFPSLKEGSSRVIYEAMASDTSVIVLRENVGVNKSYINEKTGWLVAEKSLGKMIVRNAPSRGASSRSWFTQNLGPINTRRKLAEDLQKHFPHESWSETDLWLKANIPEARLVETDPANAYGWKHIVGMT